MPHSTSTWLHLPGLLLTILVPLAIVFAGLWWRQRRTGNATSVDAAWSAAIGVIGVGAAVFGGGSPVQRLTVGLLAYAWSGRLTWHLLRDRVFGRAVEDGRYRAMREHWGPSANRNFFWFYQAQALAALGVAAPFLFLAQHEAPALSAVQVVGLVVAVLAQAAESLADRQLAAHRRAPGQQHLACRRGLWRFSRHPNYFFEWLTWCGVGLVAAPALGWLAMLQPAAMFVLVRFVSGVPFTERQALKSRGCDYRRYMAETSVFVPWWPSQPRGAA